MVYGQQGKCCENRSKCPLVGSIFPHSCILCTSTYSCVYTQYMYCKCTCMQSTCTRVFFMLIYHPISLYLSYIQDVPPDIVKLLVIENLMLLPSADVYIMPLSFVDYHIERRKHGKVEGIRNCILTIIYFIRHNIIISVCPTRLIPLGV